jgi:hypothetical protein
VNHGASAEGEREPYEPPAFWGPYLGAVTLAIIKVPLSVLLAWVTVQILDPDGAAAFDLMNAALWSTAIGIPLDLIAARPFILRGRSTAPGGWGFAIVPWATFTATALVISHALLQPIPGIILGSALGIVEATQVACLREWKTGTTDEEERQRWKDFKELTRATFADDIAEIRRRQEDRVMEGYRRKIAERERERGHGN